MSDSTDNNNLKGTAAAVTPLSLNPLNQALQKTDIVPARGQRRRYGFGAMHNVPITMIFEVGQIRISIGELLALNKGSVIALSHAAVDAIDIYVDEIIVAHGEIITFKDKYGVRFGEIVGITDSGEGT